ncbi:hypothetical protein R3P38DRAFT_158029 [Favolaschia claudopus]|uniref:Uncharacterized protein n=1 Tax=Favolaschia claudopus TaxID=2862362 RepID=A0AAV9ZU87_9AGAR
MPPAVRGLLGRQFAQLSIFRLALFQKIRQSGSAVSIKAPALLVSLGSPHSHSSFLAVVSLLSPLAAPTNPFCSARHPLVALPPLRRHGHQHLRSPSLICRPRFLAVHIPPLLIELFLPYWLPLFRHPQHSYFLRPGPLPRPSFGGHSYPTLVRHRYCRQRRCYSPSPSLPDQPPQQLYECRSTAFATHSSCHFHHRRIQVHGCGCHYSASPRH